MADSGTYIIPPASFPPKPNGVAPTQTLNNAARANEWQCSSIVALGAVIPLIYGYDRIGAKYLDCFSVGGTIWLVVVWCLGPVESIVKIETSNGEALPANIVMRHYLGGQTTPDARLVTAFKSAGRALPPTALTDCCYTVMEVPSATAFSPDGIVAYIKGRKVFSPRDPAQHPDLPSTWKWSDNAAECLSDFLSNTRYGYRRRVLWDSVAAVADLNDEKLGSTQERRRTLNLAICDKQEPTTLIEALRTYAGCWVVAEDDALRLVPDMPGDVVHAFTQADMIGIPQRNGRGIRQAPTVVCINYTDTTATPWKTASAYAYAPGVKEGSERYVESVVALPGIHSYSAAMREAVERLNKLRLGDLEITAVVADIGVLLQAGDLVAVWHPTTPDGKIYRLLESPRPTEDGNWQLTCAEYQPTMYCDDVYAQPVYGDTTLPDPANPPAITGLEMREVLYQKQSRKYGTRFEASWQRPDWPYSFDYVCELTSAGQVIDVATVHTEAYASPDVQEGRDYVLRVAVKTQLLAGPFAAVSAVGLGKQLPPGNVPAWTQAIEAGGKIWLTWEEAPDITVNDKSDVERYEIRRAPDRSGLNLQNLPEETANALWNSGALIDQIDALSTKLEGEPAGTWLYMIKAIDSVKNYSPLPTIVRITVTLDVNAFLLDHFTFTQYQPVNMTPWQRFTEWRRRWTTDMSDPAGYGVAGNFEEHAGEVVATYHSPDESSLTTDIWDACYEIGGYWQITADIVEHEGNAQVELELSSDMAQWTRHAGGAAHATGRYARVTVTTSGTMTVADGIMIRVNAIPREESHVVDVGATGVTTVLLNNRYAKATSVTPTVLGTVPCMVVADNIIIGAEQDNSVDLYAFDSNYQRVSARIQLVFKGI